MPPGSRLSGSSRLAASTTAFSSSFPAARTFLFSAQCVSRAGAPALGDLAALRCLRPFPSSVSSFSTGPARRSSLAAPKEAGNEKKEHGEARERPRTGAPLKTPKGTRDWTGADLVLRDEIFQTISEVFRQHGGVPLDTPVFELKEVLAGKYGEDARLIYDLADQGGELCALRYDLTVPFARWLAMNKVPQFRRYHIAKVYRRDQPALARGRLREFYQCDFDIAGAAHDRMIPDAEILRVVYEVFRALGEPVAVRINHRQILDGFFAVAGVPADRVRAISSAVDKLDKLPWAEVRREMVQDKGLDADVADRIGELVQHSGSIAAMAAHIQADTRLWANADVRQGVADLELLASYLEALGVDSSRMAVSLDLSLCRGLDYYTGMIYEVVSEGGEVSAASSAASSAAPSGQSRSHREHPQVGSIAAGGRYDNLAGMYGKAQIPCVGISFGVDRIFTLLKARRETEAEAARLRRLTRATDVFVMAFGGSGFGGMLAERMGVAQMLWDAGIRAGFMAKAKPRLAQQFKAAEDVPLGVILGEDELARGQVRLKVLGVGGPSEEGGLGDSSEKDRGQLVAQEDLVGEIKKKLKEL